MRAPVGDHDMPRIFTGRLVDGRPEADSVKSVGL